MDTNLVTEQSKPADPFFLKIKSVEELLGEPIPEVKWLIDKIWVDGARGFIAGVPGIGKTWLALEMLICVATGMDFLGKYKVPKKGPCLLIEEESSEVNLQRRFHEMNKAFKLMPEELRDLHVVTRSFLKIPRDEKELIECINDSGFKLVVFDSLRRIHNQDENSSEEMQPVLESLAHIQDQTGISIVLIHHLRKDSAFSGGNIFERMRGTSDLWAWRDCIIGLEGVSNGDKAKCSFQFRDAEPSAPFILKRDSNDEDGVHLYAENLEDQEEFNEKIQEIKDVLKNSGKPLSKNSIQKEVKGKRQETFRAIDYAARKGWIVKKENKWCLEEE